MRPQNAKSFLKSITPPIIIDLLRTSVAHSPKEMVPVLTLEKNKESIQSDEYIRWLCQILGGFLDSNNGNIVAFDHAVRHMPDDGAIIEIGSFLGLSTNIIAYLTIKHGRNNRFFNCDPWRFEETEKPVGGYFDASSNDFREYVKKLFATSVELFSKNRKPYSIESTSEQFLRQWKFESAVKDVFGRETVLGGPISFAYIDGAHTYEAAKNDFLGIDRDLLPGGFVLFDDSADDSPFECRKVVAEMMSNPKYEMTFKTPNYFFRKKG
jgi:hypothetical protein